jgi:hypothetical protein
MDHGYIPGAENTHLNVASQIRSCSGGTTTTNGTISYKR